MIKKVVLCILVMTMAACSETEQPQNKETPKKRVESSHTTSVERFVENVHYRKLEKPLAVNEGKINVTEVFWYGCPACQHFEPYINRWDQRKPSDVELTKLPANWGKSSVLHAKLYFIAKTFENFEEIHKELFKEIINVKSEKDINKQQQALSTVFTKFGMSESDLLNHLESFTIKSQVEQATEFMRNAGVRGTPALVVNGKYMVINKNAHSEDEVFEVVDFLIDKERQSMLAKSDENQNR